MSNPESASPQAFQIPCPHLRSKEMYHQPLGQEDGQFASGLFWCTRTQEIFGPDGQPVSKGECCQGRACYGT
jgi:hypothetical protein